MASANTGKQVIACHCGDPDVLLVERAKAGSLEVLAKPSAISTSTAGVSSLAE